MTIWASGLSDYKINARISSIKKIYILFAVLVIFRIVSLVAGFSQRRDINKAWELIFVVVIFFSIYYGLNKRKEWTIPLVLIFSAYCLLDQFLYSPFLKHTDLEASYKGFMLYKSFQIFENIIFMVEHLLVAFFYAYQIYFFSKKEVRKIFSLKGTIIFS